MFIMSLAIADLTVGLFVMPISSTYVLMGDWPFGLVVCQIWLSADYTASTSSILNLLILSLDRYWSVRSPLKYMRKRTKKRALLMIAVVWIVSSLWILPIICWHLWANEGGLRKQPENVCETEFADNVLFKVTTSTANFYVPLLLMIGVYVKIYLEIKKRSQFEIGQCNIGGSSAARSGRTTPVSAKFIGKDTTGKITDTADDRGQSRPCRYASPSNRFTEYQASTPSSSSGGPSMESLQPPRCCDQVNTATTTAAAKTTVSTPANISDRVSRTEKFRFRNHQSSSLRKPTRSNRTGKMLLTFPFAHHRSKSNSSRRKNDLCTICNKSSSGIISHDGHGAYTGNSTLKTGIGGSTGYCTYGTESVGREMKSDFIWRCDNCGKTIKNFATCCSTHGLDHPPVDATHKAHSVILKDLRPFCRDCHNAATKLKHKSATNGNGKTASIAADASSMGSDDVTNKNRRGSSVSCFGKGRKQNSNKRRKTCSPCHCFAKKHKRSKNDMPFVSFETRVEECDSINVESTPTHTRKSTNTSDVLSDPSTPTAHHHHSGKISLSVSDKDGMEPSHLQVPLQIFRSNSLTSEGSFRRSSTRFLSNLRKSTKRGTSGSHSLRQEKKAARQLGVIMGAFVLCWLPYIIIFIVTACCDDCLNADIHTATIWLGYLNSTVNPLIYALCNANFKRAFWKMAGRSPINRNLSGGNNPATHHTNAKKTKKENMFA